MGHFLDERAENRPPRHAHQHIMDVEYRLTETGRELKDIN